MKEHPDPATLELALIKIEVDAWLNADKDGLGQLSAEVRMRRIAQRFEGFELIAHPADGPELARLEISFPPGRMWANPQELAELGRSAKPFCDQCDEISVYGNAPAVCPHRSPLLLNPSTTPLVVEQRSSMRTLFEFRTRSWVKWFVLPLAWLVSLLGAWWVLH